MVAESIPSKSLWQEPGHRFGTDEAVRITPWMREETPLLTNTRNPVPNRRLRKENEPKLASRS